MEISGLGGETMSGKETKDVVFSVVTPVRNEGRTIKDTIESVIKQTIRPKRWVIIDDGSTDNTGEILKAYAEKNDWIEVLHFEDKGYSDYEMAHRKLGAGLERLLQYQNDYIVKMDGDITFESNYFEEIFRRFDADPQLGIAGGVFYVLDGGQYVLESSPLYHVRGASKIYRWKCWEDIGGFVHKLGYDTIDEIQAHMKGWKTRSFPELKVIHHRKTFTRKGKLGSAVYQGKLNYLVWYHPLYVILKSAKFSLTRKPYFFYGAAFIYGFLKCYAIGLQRSINDEEFKRYIRGQQLRKLMFRSTILK